MNPTVLRITRQGTRRCRHGNQVGDWKRWTRKESNSIKEESQRARQRKAQWEGQADGVSDRERKWLLEKRRGAEWMTGREKRKTSGWKGKEKNTKKKSGKEAEIRMEIENLRKEKASEPAKSGVKILSDQVHIIGLVNIHSFLRYSEG